MFLENSKGHNLQEAVIHLTANSSANVELLDLYMPSDRTQVALQNSAPLLDINIEII